MTIRRAVELVRFRVVIIAVALVLAPPTAAQPGAIFPQSFVLEHRLEQLDADGTSFLSEPVVDTYGGSWIVSQRPDGSRLLIDLARRELTEVRPSAGTFWSVSFDRFVDLQRRYRAVEAPFDAAPAAEPDGVATRAQGAPAAEPALVVLEEPSPAIADRSFGRAASGAPATSADLTTRPGVRRLRVVERHRASDPDAGYEAWVDPSIRLETAAREALQRLDTVLGGAASDSPSAASTPGRYLAAARAHAQGALPVRTSRPAMISAAGEPLGRIDDVVTRLEPLERFPRELLEIPEGLRRVPHPLEAVTRFLEEEKERNRQLAGGSRQDGTGG